MAHAPNEAHWKITSGAFHHKISQVPKAHIADALVLFPFIENGAYELVCEKIGVWYVKGWQPLF